MLGRSAAELFSGFHYEGRKKEIWLVGFVGFCLDTEKILATCKKIKATG